MMLAAQILYVLSAVLPIIAIARAFRAASRDSSAIKNAAPPKSGTGASVGQFDAAMEPLVRWISRRPTEIAVDMLLIGGGVVLGAIASLISLALP